MSDAQTPANVSITPASLTSGHKAMRQEVASNVASSQYQKADGRQSQLSLLSPRSAQSSGGNHDGTQQGIGGQADFHAPRRYRIKRQKPGCCWKCNASYGGCCDPGASCGGCNSCGCCDRPRIIYFKSSEFESNTFSYRDHDKN